MLDEEDAAYMRVGRCGLEDIEAMLWRRRAVYCLQRRRIKPFQPDLSGHL
jgi:hypothetical protein